MPVGTWAIAEISFGILCACLPVMPRFVKTVGPKIYSTTLFGKSSSPKVLHSVRRRIDAERTARNRDSNILVDPYDPDNMLTGRHLDNWEITPEGKEHKVIMTSPNLKRADLSFAEGQIIQTRSFNVEQSSQKVGGSDEVILWR